MAKNVEQLKLERARAWREYRLANERLREALNRTGSK